MELKEFIKATITAISESIEDLNKKLENKANINPKSVNMLDRSGKSQTDRLINVLGYGKDGVPYGSLIQYVEFNLAITEAKEKEKGGGIRIEVINAGVNSKKEIENINTVKPKSGVLNFISVLFPTIYSLTFFSLSRCVFYTEIRVSDVVFIFTRVTGKNFFRPLLVDNHFILLFCNTNI
jgi:hypothetical protein